MRAHSSQLAIVFASALSIFLAVVFGTTVEAQSPTPTPTPTPTSTPTATPSPEPEGTTEPGGDSVVVTEIVIPTPIPTPVPPAMTIDAPDSVHVDSSATVTVYLSNLVSLLSYTLDVKTTNSDLTFNEQCNDTTATASLYGSTSYIKSFTLYGCDRYGAYFEAYLKRGDTTMILS